MEHFKSALAFNNFNQLSLSARMGSLRAESLYGGSLGGKWWRNYLHVHSFFEVCYVFDGAGKYHINDRRHDLHSGDLIIARPGEAHEIVSSRKSPLGIYFWAYTLARDPDHQAESGDGRVDSLMQGFIDSPRCIMSRQQAMQRTLAMMTQEMADAASGYLSALAGLMVKLLLDTARAVVPASGKSELPLPRGRSAAEAVAQTAIQYLRDNLGRRFEVRDVAAQVNLSERQLTRIFHQATGKSVLAYLTALRIDRASQLLLERDMPIKQVGAAVGYPDTHYFTTLFGQRTGMTPGEFRRSAGTRLLDHLGRRHVES